MDVTKACESRFSCRKYTDEDVGNGLIEQCLECARIAPSALNKQPWKFYVTRGDLKARIAKETQLFGANGFTDQAPVLVVVTVKPKLADKMADKIKHQDFSSIDLGIAVQSFCLKATDLGLGTCIIGWVNCKNVDKLLPLSLGEKTKLVISLGYPACEQPPRRRKSMEETAVYLS